MKFNIYNVKEVVKDYMDELFDYRYEEVLDEKY